MQETLVRSLGWEDPLEKGTATHSSILAKRIPWIEEPTCFFKILLSQYMQLKLRLMETKI